MDSLNSLSDQELRQRLLQYGLNLPVTSSTRNLLIKKLRNHMESEQAKLKQATSYVTRYSSDEDTSDHEVKRRQRATMPPPKTNIKRINPPSITKISPRSQSVYVSPVVRHNMNTDSDDDNDRAKTSTNNLNSTFSNAYGGSTNNRSYTARRTSSTLYPSTTHPTLSQSFTSSHSNNSSVSREHIATTNGHSDDLFSDYSHYRRPALSLSSCKYFSNSEIRSTEIISFLLSLTKFDT